MNFIFSFQQVIWYDTIWYDDMIWYDVKNHKKKRPEWTILDAMGHRTITIHKNEKTTL